MNGYVGFYRGKRAECLASTTFEAQRKLAEKLGAKKTYQVSVVLAEKSGEQVTHSTTTL